MAKSNSSPSASNHLPSALSYTMNFATCIIICITIVFCTKLILDYLKYTFDTKWSMVINRKDMEISSLQDQLENALYEQELLFQAASINPKLIESAFELEQ